MELLAKTVNNDPFQFDRKCSAILYQETLLTDWVWTCSIRVRASHATCICKKYRTCFKPNLNHVYFHLKPTNHGTENDSTAKMAQMFKSFKLNDASNGYSLSHNLTFIQFWQSLLFNEHYLQRQYNAFTYQWFANSRNAFTLINAFRWI